jgi:hypothetical protein
MKIRDTISKYRQDNLIDLMWNAFRSAESVRSISLDITHKCNLRCRGCYFFAEEMDKSGEASREDLKVFIQTQKSRGINFVTVIGGEPSLFPDRLRLVADNFRVMVVTNGLKALPQEGLEDVTIAVSMWGDRATDRLLRGYGKIDIFDKALQNYAGDARVRWYITLPANPAEETAEVVDACVANGNLVGFNYYGDLESIGDAFSHRHGFSGARKFVERMIARYPTAIASTRYLNEVVSSGLMKGEVWGYDVCGSVSVDAPQNAKRLLNGKSYNPFFNAYGPDLGAPRRCCVGEERSCSTCFDVWAHMSWVGMAMEKHLCDEKSFFDWLATMVVFYGSCRFIDAELFEKLLPKIHQRSAIYRQSSMNGMALTQSPAHAGFFA